MKQQELLQDGSNGKQIKVLLDFFCEGHPPPVCLRCSPGLFRHSRGAVSCHTSSMPCEPTPCSDEKFLADHSCQRAAGSPKSRGPGGSAPGRPSQRAKLPRRARRETSARRSGRNPLSSKAPSADGAIPGQRPWPSPPPPTGGGRRGPFIPLGVGAGIPDGPGRNAPWTRQGCRALRNGYAFAPMHRSTSFGTARRHTQVPPYEHGRTAPRSLWGGYVIGHGTT